MIMWNTIIGHERQKEQIRRVVASSNVPHAYLFSGINGVGKRQVARVTAATLLCKQSDGKATPCGECVSCQKFANRTHPDLIEIVPENNYITIDLIRRIQDQLKFSPLEGERRVIIIDHAELMNANAANAALKILEEPPAGNHFFLITATPSQLLPTIISRCQKMEFSPLTNEELERYLVSHHGYSKERAKLATEISEGSIERALSITTELIDSVTEDIYRLLKQTTASGVLELSSRWASEKEGYENILYILHRSFHNALIHGNTMDSANRPNMTDRLSNLIREKNDTGRLIEKCNLINQTHSFLTRTYNKQLMFEQLLFTLTE